MNKIEIQFKHEITEDMILDVITTALEGGIGYWSILRNDHPDWVAVNKTWKEKHGGETPCWCDTCWEILSAGKSVFFEDAEDEDEIWELTKDKLISGITQWEVWRGTTLNKAFKDASFDAEDADCIFQFALFNELVFG